MTANGGLGAWIDRLGEADEAEDGISPLRDAFRFQPSNRLFRSEHLGFQPIVPLGTSGPPPRLLQILISRLPSLEAHVGPRIRHL
jgi:hypothetical protein